MDQITFYRNLKQHCTDQNAECTKCCLRLYCYTPPCERTDAMMEKVIEFLVETQNNRNGHSQNHEKDHYTCRHQPECPCNMDMSSAIGCEHH